MDIGNLLLAFWDPGIGEGFVHALAVIVNLAFIAGGVTLLAYMCCQLRTKPSDPPEQLRRKPTAAYYAVAIATTVGLIALSVFAALDQSQETLVSGSYSLADLARFTITIIDPLLNISNLADSPIKDFFGLNLIIRAAIIYILVAALLFSIKQAGNAAVHFNSFLKEKFLADQPQRDDSSEDGDREKTAKDEIQILVGRLVKLFLSGGSAIFAAFVLGSDDMRESISEVLEIFEEIIGMMTLLPNVGTGEGASGYFSDVLYILLSLVMLAIYVTAALLLIIFIHTIYKNWSTIVEWLIKKAKSMRTGVAAILLAVTSSAIVIGAGICLKKYPILQLDFEGGITEALRIVINYAVVILVIVTVLMLLIFAASFLALVAAYAWDTVKQKDGEWKKDFSNDKYWNIAKAAACVILAGILLVAVALSYEKLRDWLIGIFNPGKDIFSPAQVFRHAAIFAALLEGLVLLISTAAVLGFIVFWGIVEFFLTTRKNVVFTASKLVKETLTALLDMLSLAPFVLRQVCLLVKSVVETVLKIFTGYRTESEKNNAIFMAACFASLASLLNTFFGLYQFYGGGDKVSGYSEWVRTICTLAIACAAQLAMLVFGMKAGEGLAEWRITGGDHVKNKLIRITARVIGVIGVFLTAGCVYAIIRDIFLNDDFHPKDLIKYIPWVAGSLATFALYFWLRKKWKCSRNNEPQTASTEEKPILTEILPSQSAPNQLHQLQKRRLPFYWYLAVYLLLMIISTGFAYSNLFGYYAHGAKVHERVYSQVRYETDRELQLSERVAKVVEDYAETTRELGNLFSTRAANAMQARNDKVAELRSLAENESAGVYVEGNRRDRFIGLTKDLEQVVSNIQSLLTAQYDNIGSEAAIEVEEYAHYWGYSSQPSYNTTCIIIHLDGSLDGGSSSNSDGSSDDESSDSDDNLDDNSDSSLDGNLDSNLDSDDKAAISNKGQIITVGDFVEKHTLTEFPVTAHQSLRGRPAPAGRIEDPASPSQSIILTTRYVLNADKYVILKELFNQYERIENQIYSFEVSDAAGGSETTSLSNVSAFSGRYATLFGINYLTLNQARNNTNATISEQIYPGLDKNSQLDGIRANIAALYQDSIRDPDNSTEEQTPLEIPMSGLPRIAEAYLNGNGTSDSDISSKEESDLNDNDANDRKEGSEEDNESDEKTALSEFENLSDYIDRALTLNSILLSFDTNLKDDYGESDAVYKTQQYRNYARGIAHLEFQISYDALFHGCFMNPVSDKINELYTTSTIAVFLLLICLLIDMLAFFSGLLLFKSIYLFGKNAGILQMGYLNYEIALSYLFAVPKDFHSRVLHLAFIYKVLHGDASTPVELEDSDIGDDPPGNDEQALEGDPSDTPPGSDNMASVGHPEEADTSGTSDGTDSVGPDQSGPDEQNSAGEDAVDSENSASNPQLSSDNGGEAEESLSEEETSIPESDSKPEEGLPQVAGYFQDMDYLHQIMRSEDYKRLDENIIATLKILGIIEFNDGNEEQNSNYAALQLWLRKFVKENNITFDELFPSKDE